MRTARIATEPDHAHSLADDLVVIERWRRRRLALSWIASGAGSVLLNACGGGGSSDATTTPTATATTAATPTTSASTCLADPAETAGPYPADGTNTASGATSDILTASGIVRSDLRGSFLGSTTTAPGVNVTITLTLVNTNSVCSTLSGYAIYLWHCDRAGNYSLYSAPAESWLRGVQVTDSAGQVTFTTIFPGCYAGRYPHMHFEVFANLAAATSGRNAVLTSQLAMPAAVCNIVYPVAAGYAQSVTNFAQTSIASDNVFGDNTAAQIALMTPTMTGSAGSGYVATATIGVAR